MNQRLTIKQLADASGVPAKTIRYYEDVGLLALPERGGNGYRLYTQKAIQLLRVIKYARDLGLPIAEVKKLMQGCHNGHCEHTKKYLEQEIRSYVQLLEQKISRLTTLKQQLLALDSSVASNENSSYCCNILYQLAKGGEDL